MKCGLIGEHLSHSFSPLIHGELTDYDYQLYELPPEKLGDFVKGGGLDAFNVTIPYKKDVMQYLDEISPEALSIGSVNTGIASVISNANKAEIEDTTLKKPVSFPCPKWEIYIDKAGEYRFRLYAINGLCVCHSAHGYSTKPGCKGGIESIRRYAEEATVGKSYLK